MTDELTQMRPSRVLAKLRAGEVAICLKLNLSDPRSAEIAARSGPDCIWTDMEHVPNTLSQVENQVRAGKAYDVDSVVRVQRGSYSNLIQPLEMDATGIMVPHVMSAEDARKIAWFTRFHPVGRRPIDGGNSDGCFCMLPIQEYVKTANEQRFVIIQIEDPEPLDELEEIAQVEGIDVILFGAGDFSHGIGALGKFDDPRIQETRVRVAEVARKYGKFAGALCTTEQIPEYVDMGYQFLNVGADVVCLSLAFRDIIASARGTKAEGAESSYSSWRRK